MAYGGRLNSAPEIAVVVPAHKRTLRLRWLLNALEDQTLDPARFEVLVGYDTDDPAVTSLVQTHPLTAAGVLRPIGSDDPAPAVKRNACWRAARANLVIFTDDDCRPPDDWLERALEAARAHPGAVVQGRTQPEPAESEVERSSPHATTQWIDPPTRWGQTCNILYPVALLDRLGGFDPTFPLAAGEDSDLLLRARRAGAEHAGAPEVLTYHAVQDHTLAGRLRTIPRWGALAYVFKRHPAMRAHQPLRMFWKPTHPALLLGLAGAVAAVVRRQPAWLLLGAVWARSTWPAHGRHPRGVVRSLSELPARGAIDAAEIAALARGSVRYRTLFL